MTGRTKSSPINALLLFWVKTINLVMLGGMVGVCVYHPTHLSVKTSSLGSSVFIPDPFNTIQLIIAKTHTP